MQILSSLHSSCFTFFKLC